MLSQFETSNWLRCPATDAEGFRCGKPPSHAGDHRWSRCAWLDDRGRRCALPPKHGGRHWLLWYDEPAEPGDTRTMRYGGTEAAAAAMADRAGVTFGRHGWVCTSRHFEPGLLWRHAALAPLRVLFLEPRGRLTVAYEYRPEVDSGAGSPREA